MTFINKLSDFLSKYFIILIILAAFIAIIKPETFLSLNTIKPFGQTLTNLGLGFIMFIMGLTLNINDFKIVFTKPKEVMVGCLMQFTIMPLLAFSLAKLFNLPSELAIGLVLLGTCPGGTSSNVLTYIAKGDVALSVGMTTISTFISPILTPFLTMILVGEWVSINTSSMFFSIIQIVILPSILGILLHNLLKDKLEKYTKSFVIFPIITIIFITGMCIAPNKQNLLNSSFLLILAVCFHNWLGFFAGYIIGSLFNMSTSKKKTLAIEVGLQNAALSIGLAAQFSNPLCALPGAVAVVVHLISGSILANLFSNKEKLKKFIFLKKAQYE